MPIIKNRFLSIPNIINNKNTMAFTMVELSIVITVISLLVALVSSSRLLINKAKTYKARIATASAPILNITNANGEVSARLWLESSNPDHYKILSDNIVEIWYDQSPYGNNVTNGTDANYLPTIALGAINDYSSALYFDGNDQLYSEGKVPLAFDDDEYSIVAVWKTPNTARQVIWEQNSSIDISGITSYARGSLILDTSGYGFSGQDTENTAITSYATATNNITILIKDNLNLSLYHLGDLTSATIPTATTLYTERHSIGTKSSASDEYFTGYIAEIIVFDKVLTNEEVEEIHKYLFSKYGIRRT